MMYALIARRQFLLGGSFAALGSAAILPWQDAHAADMQVFEAAKKAREGHRHLLKRNDIYGVVDFSIPSYQPRLFLISTQTEKILGSFLCAHGLGSDPGDTPHAIPTKFSNERGSKASSLGSYITGERYISSQHGPSLRLNGLDTTNSNALSRYIVIHSNWYVNSSVQQNKRPIGRSWGCFVTTEIDRDFIIDALHDGAFLYAGFPTKSPSGNVSSPPIDKPLEFSNWHLRADGISENSYVNTTDGRTLLQYTTNDEDEVYLFMCEVAVDRLGQYRLKFLVETGESPSPFNISVENAVDAITKQPILKTVGERTTVMIDNLVETTGNTIAIKIRSKPDIPAKIWVFAHQAKIEPR